MVKYAKFSTPLEADVAKKATAKKQTPKGAAKLSPKEMILAKLKALPLIQKVALGVVLIVVVFFLYVGMQPSEYLVERQITIEAPVGKIFPHVNDFHNWSFWYPWAKLDPTQKITIDGAPLGVGSVYHWAGDDKVGEGSLTIVSSVKDSQIDIEVNKTKPSVSKNKMTFIFLTNGDKETGIKWRMTGKNSYMDKLTQQFVSLDESLGATFQRGLEYIKVATQPGYQTNE